MSGRKSAVVRPTRNWAAEEASRRAAEEASRWTAEASRLAAEEARRWSAEDASRRAAEEASRRAAKEASRRAAIVERHVRQIAEAQRRAARLFEDNALSFANSEEKATARQLRDRLANIAVGSDPLTSERAAGEAAELVAAINQTLGPAHWRHDTTMRLDRMSAHIADLPVHSALVDRRQSLVQELSRLKQSIANAASESQEFSTKLAVVGGTIDELAASSITLNNSLSFLDSVGGQGWADDAEVKQWRDLISASAGRSHSELTIAIGTVVQQTSLRYDAASAESAQLVRQREATAAQQKLDLLNAASSLEHAIFERDSVSQCMDLILPASAQLVRARQALSRGDSDTACSLIEDVTRFARELPTIANERQRKGAAEHEAWQAELDNLADEARAKDSESPDLVAQTLVRIEDLRNRPSQAARSDVSDLRLKLDQASAEAARRSAAEVLIDLLRKKAGVPEDELEQIRDLPRAPGRTVLVAGRISGIPLELEVSMNEDGSLCLQKGDDSQGDPCAAVDAIVAELAHRFGEEAVDYFEEDGSARPIPAITATRNETAQSKLANRAIQAGR